MNSLSFKLDRNSLADALKQAARVAEKSNTIPILSHVLFSVRPDFVTITATDLDIELTCELPAAAESEGCLALPLFVLKDAVGKLKGETVTIEDLGTGKALLSCGASGARVVLGALSPDDFPVMVRGDMVAQFCMPAATLGDALATVLPFTSKEETRYYLMGAFIHAACERPAERTEEHESLAVQRSELMSALTGALDEAGPTEERSPEAQAKLELVRGRITTEIAEIDAQIAVLEAERTRPDVMRFATTDGHRLGRYTIPLPEGAEDIPDVIVPTKVATLVAKHLVGRKPSSPDISVAVSRTKAEFSYGRFTVLAKMIDGTYPDYTRVIPYAPEHRLTVPAVAFASAVESVAAIANEKTRAVAISMSDDDGVILTCSSAQGERSAVIFEQEPDYVGPEPSGNALVVGFNAKYLADALSPFPDRVTISTSDCGAPARVESADRPELLIVLMPMRVGDCVTTRADVERLSANPWQAFKHDTEANVAHFNKVNDGSRPGPIPDIWQWMQRTRAKDIQAAIAYLVDRGEPRRIARLKAKAELAYIIGTPETVARADAMIKLVALYGAEPSGSFHALTFRSTQDPVRPDPATLDPAEAEAEIDDAANGDVALIATETSTETVAVQEEVSVSAPAEQVSVVKVLTLTGQALFVSMFDWADGSIAALPRYTRDGQRMGDRTVLRENLARLVPPRNRGDRPLPAPMPKPAPAAEPDIAERLGTLEYLIEGLALQLSPQGSAVDPWSGARRARAVRAYLQLRSMRVAHASRVADAERFERLWGEALAERDQLKVRCNALERLHVASGPLDAPPALNGHVPAIILPPVRSSARAS